MDVAATLTNFGLSQNEAKLYLALVDYGRMPVSTLSRATGVHRRNVYDALDRLVQRGLAFQVIGGRENIIEPVAPDKLLQLMEEQQKALKATVSDLKKRFSSQAVRDEAYIYQGLEGYKNYLQEVIRVGEDLYIIGAKGFWFDPKIESFSREFIKEARRKKITLHHLFDAEVKEKMPELLIKFKTHRVLPAEYSTSVTVSIFGDYVVSFVGNKISELGPSRDIKLFINVNKEMAQGYRTWFKFLWQASSPKGR